MSINPIFCHGYHSICSSTFRFIKECLNIGIKWIYIIRIVCIIICIARNITGEFQWVVGGAGGEKPLAWSAFYCDLSDTLYFSGQGLIILQNGSDRIGLSNM